jgi:hypothetical protein
MAIQPKVIPSAQDHSMNPDTLPREPSRRVFGSSRIDSG